jgi:hypothetical protein
MAVGHTPAITAASCPALLKIAGTWSWPAATAGSQARVTGHGGMALFDLPMPCQPALQSQLLAVSLPRRDYC